NVSRNFCQKSRTASLSWAGLPRAPFLSWIPNSKKLSLHHCAPTSPSSTNSYPTIPMACRLPPAPGVERQPQLYSPSRCTSFTKRFLTLSDPSISCVVSTTSSAPIQYRISLLFLPWEPSPSSSPTATIPPTTASFPVESSRES